MLHMAEIRTFICFELPKDVKKVILELQNRLRTFGKGVAWSRIDGVHLTLKFLGNVEEERIESIAAAVARACDGGTPIDMTLGEAGAFPNVKHPRVFWLGINESSGRLLTLQRNIESALAQFDFPKDERPFSPHLTLGRVKHLDEPEKIARALSVYRPPALSFTVDEVAVMKSELLQAGAAYTPLHKIKLNGAEV